MRLAISKGQFFLLAAFILICSNVSFGQFTPKTVLDWTVLEETNQYKIEMRTQDCLTENDDMDKIVLVLRVTNLTKKDLDLNWDFDYFYNNKCLTCNSNSVEYKSKLKLTPLQTIEGNCESSGNTLKHFVKFKTIETSVLTDFKIKNIQVLSAE